MAVTPRPGPLSNEQEPCGGTAKLTERCNDGGEDQGAEEAFMGPRDSRSSSALEAVSCASGCPFSTGAHWKGAHWSHASGARAEWQVGCGHLVGPVQSHASQEVLGLQPHEAHRCRLRARPSPQHVLESGCALGQAGRCGGRGCMEPTRAAGVFTALASCSCSLPQRQERRLGDRLVNDASLTTGSNCRLG